MVMILKESERTIALQKMRILNEQTQFNMSLVRSDVVYPGALVNTDTV